MWTHEFGEWIEIDIIYSLRRTIRNIRRVEGVEGGGGGVVTSPKEIPARETCLRKFLQAVLPKKYLCNGKKNPWTQVGLKKMPAPKIFTSTPR